VFLGIFLVTLSDENQRDPASAWFKVDLQAGRRSFGSV
jgi:hypothetical protein